MPCDPLCQASGANGDVIFAEEDCIGTFQTDSSKWKGLRITSGETLESSINRFESAELTPTRDVLNTAGGNIRAGGGVNFELAPEGWATIMKHLLAATPTVSGSVGAFCHIIKSGNTFPNAGLSLEKRFNDINKFLRYWGCRIDSLNLNFPQEGYVTGSMNLLGFGEISDENASQYQPPGTYGPSGVSVSPAATFPTDEPFVTFSSVIQEGNPLANVTFVQSASIAINNAFEQDGFIIGSRYRACLTPGKRSITGNLQIFFKNLIHYNKFLNETRTALRFYFERGSKSIEFYLPRVEFTGESPKISTPGGLSMNLPWRALYDSTEGCALRVTIKSTEANI